MVVSNSLFLSYRRSVGFAWARLVWDDVTEHGIDAFLDLESIREAGHFDTKILHQIEARPYFVPVLAPGSLERCVDPGDWLRREIEHAVATERAIVPLVVDGFDFEEARRCLPPALYDAIRTSNGVPLIAEFFGEAMRRLREDRLKPIDRPSRSMSSEDLEYADAARRRAVQATVALPVVDRGDQASGAVADPPVERSDQAGNIVAGAPDQPERPDTSGRETADATAVPPNGIPPATPAGVVPRSPEAGQDSDVIWPAPPASTRPKRTNRMTIGVAILAVVAIAATLLLTFVGSDDDPVAVTPDTADVPTATASSPTSATTVPGDLGSAVRADAQLDQDIEFGSYMTSTFGDHEFGLGDDGALVVTTAGRPWRAQPAVDAAGDYWKMQGDGNLVLYRTGEEPIWSSQTSDPGRVGRDEVELILRHDPSTDDGVLQILVNGESIWTCRPDDCPERTPSQGPDKEPVETSIEPSTTLDGSSTVPTTCAPVAVPALEGRSSTDARLELSALGLRAVITEEPAAAGQDGIVLAQSPSANAVVDCGSSIDLVVGVEAPLAASD